MPADSNTPGGAEVHLDPITLRTLIQQATQRGLSRLDGQILALQALGKDPDQRAWLIAHDLDHVDHATKGKWDALLTQRLDDVPMAYITGRQEFFGLTLKVGPGVLVPRPDTETLVEWGLSCIALPNGGFETASVLDLGTGSGAIALAIKSHAPSAQVTATDASETALEIARKNAENLKLPVEFVQGSWWKPLTGRRFQLILSNPPYIAEGDHHLSALRHEPISALTSGSDGLEDIRVITRGAFEHLLPGGWLLIEHGYDQAPAVRQILKDQGFSSISSHRDLAGIERCSGGQRMTER